jgi:chorismate mutase
LLRLLTMDAAADPIVSDHREQITAIDLAILDAVNRRIELVASLHAHKRAQGYPTVDPDRERRLLERLREHNSGPISDQALERLERLILDLCTAEAARLGAEPEAKPA